MIVIPLIQEALTALWANRLRSFLTIFGIVLGVTSVIGIVSTVEGFQDDMEKKLNSMGPTTFEVGRFGIITSAAQYLERRKRKPLVRGLIPLVEEGCPDCEHVGGEGYASAHLKRGSERMRWVQINGVTSNILDMRDQDVELGRFITDQDDHSRRRVAFIGHSVAEKLFPAEDPIGQRLRLHGEEFMVIGVAKEIGEILGGDFDEFVSIPLSTHQKLFQQRGNPIAVVVKAKSRELVESAMDQTRIVLRSARRVPYEAEDDFAILTPDAIRSFIDDFTQAFRIIMIALPALSIVIGGIVIMNIMMISVTERTREIGIRKSIGARQSNIMTQFLLESIVLSIGGGIIGIIGGIKLGSMVLALMEIHATPTALAVFLGFGISTSVGLFFGIYPAMKAARLDPIKALSYE